MLFPFKKIRVKPGTVLIETVLSEDSLYFLFSSASFLFDECQTTFHSLAAAN